MKRSPCSPMLRLAPFLALTAVLAAGCGGANRVQLDRPLPFRVALMPVEVSESDLTVATPASVAEDAPRFKLSEEDLTPAIVSALNRRGFCAIDVLSRPASAPASTRSPSEEIKHWMAEARLKNADLLLQVQVFHEPNIEGETNEKFWLNLPLFLLGGPFCYFINDRSYTANAKLVAQFYSLTSGSDREDSAVFSDGPLITKYEGTQLDFTDRASGTGIYALSLVCPAGLLARNSERIIAKVQQAGLDQLTDSLLNEIATRQGTFLDNSRLGTFKLDAGRSFARRDPDQRVTLSAFVESSGRLKSYRILAGPEVFEGDLSNERTRDHRIERTMEVPPGTSTIQFEVADSLPRTRSFTFVIE